MTEMKQRAPACATCASKKTIGMGDGGYFCKEHRPTVSRDFLNDVSKCLMQIAPKCMRATCNSPAFYRITSTVGKSGKSQSERLACESHCMVNEHEKIVELKHTESLRAILKYLDSVG